MKLVGNKVNFIHPCHLSHPLPNSSNDNDNDKNSSNTDNNNNDNDNNVNNKLYFVTYLLQ